MRHHSTVIVVTPQRFACAQTMPQRNSGTSIVATAPLRYLFPQTRGIAN